MKKKITFLIILAFLICFIAVILGFEIYFCQDSWTNYNFVYQENAPDYVLDIYLTLSIQHTILCVLAGLAVCGCILIFIIIIKSDMQFIKNSLLEKYLTHKAKREELRIQEKNQRKMERITELEKELNELKKDGE